MNLRLPGVLTSFSEVSKLLNDWRTSLLGKQYRSGAASPVGSIVPLRVGEEFLRTDTSPKQWFKSTGLTNADWIQIG